MRVAEKVFALNSFKEQFNSINIISVMASISESQFSDQIDEQLKIIDWNNVLGIASILSYSEKGDHLDAALRIAQTCLMKISKSNAIQKSAASIILTNLTNQPAINLALNRELLAENYEEHYPFIFKVQSLGINTISTISLKQKNIVLNRFQKEVFDKYIKNSAISISAPTSVGKSYILCLAVIDSLLKKSQNVVYLVPTRALINQVELEFRQLIKIYGLQETNISSIPLDDIIQSQSNILIFTQERLHWFLTYNDNVEISLIIIDEAHKIEDGNRGILLQQKIEELVIKFPKIKMIFSSPFTSNPEIFLKYIPSAEKKEAINSQYTAVNQNLIYVTQVHRKPKLYQIKIPIDDRLQAIDDIKLKKPSPAKVNKIASIVFHFSKNSTSNIIYANTPSEAEKIASELYNIIQDISTSKRIRALIDLIQSSIHRKYSLTEVLKKRIAFHYGNMPLLIRLTIEDLFKCGEIRYLICTSTLLEGVNLPATSIYIYKPQKGQGKKLEMNDFWNLAGRAGRWGKEFSGNIICIEPQKWQNPPSNSKIQRKIIPALDSIESDGSALIDYIRKNEVIEKKEQKSEFESAFSYYFIKHLQDLKPTDSVFQIDLQPELIKIKEKVSLPADILKKNPGISPLGQQKLYDKLLHDLENIESYFPVSPDNENASDVYEKILNTLAQTISNYPQALNKYRANLILSWIRGSSLSYLISRSEKYYEKNNLNKKINTIIRETLDSVERFIRYEFARDSNCYVDLLKNCLKNAGKEKLIEKIPPLNLWIELGVFQNTPISFIALGLSRHTSLELSKLVKTSSLSKVECLTWLRDQNPNKLNLSPIIVEEIQKVILER